MATAATSKFVIRLEDKTKRAFKAIGRSMKSVTKSIFSMKAGLISVAGIAGLGFLIKRSMNATDEMAKMSRAIGVSVEDLGKLRHAASLGGLEATQLDKAVQKLAINMADMSRGVGLAKDVFEKHNISVSNADGSLRTVMEVMSEVADVTAGMTNQTEKADLAYKLFGARGAKMINMLNGGSEAMRAAMKEAELLGLVMSSETAKGVEDANDSFTRLQAFMSSTFAQTVAALAPAIRSMTDALIDFITVKVKETDGGIAGIATSMANTIIDATMNILQALETTANGVISFSKKIKVALGFGTEVEELEQQLIHLRGVQQDFFTEGFGNKDDGILSFFENLDTAYKKAMGKTLDFIGLEGSESVERLMLEKINAVKAQLRTLKSDGETTIEVDFSGLITSLAAAKTPIALFEDSLNTIIERGAEADVVTTALAEPKKWKFASDAFKAYSDTIKTETAQVAMVTTRLLGGAEDAIMAMISGAKFSWKSLVKGIMMDLARIQVKKAILGVASALFSFDGGGYTGSGSRSGGVDGRGGFPAILHPNETVVDHTKGGSIGGGVTTAEINFNVQAIDASSFNTYLVNNRDTIESIINNSLLSNGTVRRTIQMTS